MRRQPHIDGYAIREMIEQALRRTAALPPSARVDGRPQAIEPGLSHENCWFRVKGDSLPPPFRVLVFRRLRRGLLNDKTALASLRREAETLRALEALGASAPPTLDFDAPRFVCFADEVRGVPRAFIETALEGLHLGGLKTGEGAPPIVLNAVARAAAAVHRLPASHFPFLTHHADAAAHLEAELSALTAEFEPDDRDVADAAAWIRSHAPAGRAAAMLHCDLLPQNLLVDIDTGRPGIVDWEYACIGDPAYDLAIVTRGGRKPLGLSDGRDRLLAAYREAGGVQLEPRDLIAWELVLALGWIRDALRRYERHGGTPPEQYRAQLRAILRRAGD